MAITEDESREIERMLRVIIKEELDVRDAALREEIAKLRADIKEDFRKAARAGIDAQRARGMT